MTHHEQHDDFGAHAEPTPQMLQELGDDLDRVVASEAAYQIARRVARSAPAPWTRCQPEATAGYLSIRLNGLPVHPEMVREFEVSARALFALVHGRLPDSLAELAAYADAWFPPR